MKKFLLERQDVLIEEEIKWNEERFKHLDKDNSYSNQRKVNLLLKKRR